MWGDGDLPDEVALAILSLLDYEDLLSVSLVNRRSQVLCNDPSLWSALLTSQRKWRPHPSHQNRDADVNAGNPRAIDERLAFYASLVANLDPCTTKLFLDQLQHPKMVLRYLRHHRKRFVQFVEDSVGAAYVAPFDSFPTLLVELLMQFDFTWLLIRMTPPEKRTALVQELAYFFPPQQALCFLFFSAEQEKPRLHSTSPSLLFASAWLRVRCRHMLQQTLKQALVDRSWLHGSVIDAQTASASGETRHPRPGGLNMKKACSALFDAIFKSTDQYPLECRLYLRDVMTRAGQYYCRKREKKEAKREREAQRVEKIRLYAAQAAAKHVPGFEPCAVDEAELGVGNSLAGVTLSDEDEREASLNMSGTNREHSVEVAGDDDVELGEPDEPDAKPPQQQPQQASDEFVVPDMLVVLTHLGFKRVWSALASPEEDLLPYGTLDGHAQEKLKVIYGAMESLVGQFYASGSSTGAPTYPEWADSEWVDALKQNFTKFLLTISSVSPHELDHAEELLQKRTDRLVEIGRAMEQLDKAIFSCLMNKQLHIKLRGPRKFKCMRQLLWGLYGGVQASVRVKSMKCPDKLRPLKADVVELKTAPHCMSMMALDTFPFIDEKDVSGLEWKNRLYPLHNDIRHLLFTILFLRKEESGPTLRAKAHWRLDRRLILKEKRATVEVSLPLLCEERDEGREKGLGGLLKTMLSGSFGHARSHQAAPGRLTNSERVGELRVELHYERKFVGRRERSWGGGPTPADPDQDVDTPIPHGLFPPFVIL